MGFHFRGWFGAWMARVRSSTVSCGSPELLNGAAWFLRARRVVLAFYRQGRRGRSSWGRIFQGGRCWGRRARPWQLDRPWWSPWRAQEGWGRVASSCGARKEWVCETGGAGGWFGQGEAKWPGQVAAPAYGAAVGTVQEDGGGRNGQWQFRK